MSDRRLPVVFIGHGSPMNALEDNAWTRAWAQLGQELQRPRAILCLSAHYVTRGLKVVGQEMPQTIHDFYGFPQSLYEVSYPAPGSPRLAGRVAALLADQGAQASADWGLDHGAWSVLKVMYPAADIPVVQLSLDLTLDARAQISIGQALRPLRDEGIMLVGSGNVVHNLREIRPDQQQPFPWALAFGEAVHERVMAGHYEAMAGYTALEGCMPSVNSGEHFVPLLNILGAATREDRPRAINHNYAWGSLSMSSYVLGA